MQEKLKLVLNNQIYQNQKKLDQKKNLLYQKSHIHLAELQEKKIHLMRDI